MGEENFIEKFLDSLDINTRAYNILLFLLGILIILTLYVNYKIRSERDVLIIDKTESTIHHLD